MGILKKYKREEKDLIQSMSKRGKSIFVLSIIMKETSKVDNHQIYECIYYDGNIKKETNIIGKDISDCMDKLNAYVGMGIPGITTNHILGNEQLFSEDE